MHCWREIGILFDAEGVGYWMAREFLAGFQVLFGGMNRGGDWICMGDD